MNQKFISSLKNLGLFNSYIEDFLKKANLERSSLNRVLVSCEEIFLNICKHAYGNESREIFLDINLNMNKIIIEIRDFGIPFDPVSYVSKKADEKEEAGGLGILLVKKFMDKIKYCRKGNMNVLTLIKNVKG